ncbi:MAG: patatin-like phospholipase family protein [Puniceicoccales bacterium]|jgi:predicted acylesterase/phospholipase RssA|nr:patatin-like phospholipase family protein [Puniceicoccales bacterium]
MLSSFSANSSEFRSTAALSEKTDGLAISTPTNVGLFVVTIVDWLSAAMVFAFQYLGAMAICTASVTVAIILLVVAGCATIALVICVVGKIRHNLALHRLQHDPDVVRAFFNEYVPSLNVINSDAPRRLGCACHWQRLAKIAFQQTMDQLENRFIVQNGDLNAWDNFRKSKNVEFEKEIQILRGPGYDFKTCCISVGCFLTCMEVEAELDGLVKPQNFAHSSSDATPAQAVADASAQAMHHRRSPSASEPFNHISFSGGGMRGVGYLALWHELFEGKGAELVDMENCRFSGASVGGLVAACAAIGLTANEVKKATQTAMSLCTKFSNNKKYQHMYPALHKNINKKTSLLPKGMFDGMQLVEHMDKIIAGAVHDFLQKVNKDEISALSPEEQERVRVLSEPFQDNESREKKLVTFRDLAMLRKLSGGKRMFHPLTVTLYNKDYREVVFANEENTPDLPLITALRASMALPAAFKPVTVAIPGMYEDRPCLYADGGIINNLPIDAYEKEIGVRTLGLVFDKDGDTVARAKNPQNDASRSTRFIDFILRLAGFVPDYANLLRKQRAKLSTAMQTEEIMVVPHGNVDIMKPLVSQHEIDAAVHVAQLAVRAQVCLWKLNGHTPCNGATPA